MSIFQNFGLVVAFCILLVQWKEGKKLESDLQISMLAMIYFIFFQVNILTYVGLVHVQNFLEIIKRLASVFEMEEHKP